jgi:hypothetical protein
LNLSILGQHWRVNNENAHAVHHRHWILTTKELS